MGGARLGAGLLVMLAWAAVGCGADDETESTTGDSVVDCDPDTQTCCGKGKYLSVCGSGEYCCNSSCGTCAPDGEACATIACEP